jgi:hypothetical protein
MAAALGSLVVSLGLDAAEFTSGLTKAEYDARRFGEALGRDIKAAAAFATGAFSAIGVAATAAFAAIKSQTDAVDAFNDLSDATGSSIENLSALDRVARETGGSFETAESILLKFNKTLGDAGLDSDSGRLFKALNLDIAQLKQLDPAEALRRTAVAFNGFERDANSARAMQELFGKSVKEAAPFLKDLAEQSELVGSISTQAAEQAETFNKQISALRSNAQDAARSFTIGLLPAMNRFLQNFSEIKKLGAFDLIIKDAAKDVFGFGQLTGENGADIKKFMSERDRLQKDMNFAAGKGLPTRDIEGRLAENARYLELLRSKQSVEIAALFGGDYSDTLSRKLGRTQKLPDFAKSIAGGSGKVAKDLDPTKTDAYRAAMKAAEDRQNLRIKEADDIAKFQFGVVEAEDRFWRDVLAATPTAKLEEQRVLMDKLASGYLAGKFGAVGSAEAIASYGEVASTALGNLGKTFEEADGYAKKFAENMQDVIGSGLADIANGNFKSIGDGFTQLITRMAAEALAADIARKLFGSSIKGGEGDGWLGSLLSIVGMGKATGGSVSAGMMYPVNEQGPELLDVNGKQMLMMGSRGGRVTPNSQLGGKAPITLHYHSAPGESRQTAGQRMGQAARILQSAGRYN